MSLKFEKEIEDNRGKILFFSYGNKTIHMVEIKKNFARGGHYHPFESDHILISGKIEYHEENVLTKKNKKVILHSPSLMTVPANSAHLLIALEDSIFVETFEDSYQAIDYPKFRQIVLERMNEQTKI